MFFKLICYLSLVIADLFLTKWIPLKETLHYYYLHQKLQSQKESKLQDDDQLDEDSPTELILQKLAKKSEERLDFLSWYWVFQGVVCYMSYLFNVFPFVYEGRVMMLIMVSNPKI